MCDRYTLTASFEVINKVFKLNLDKDLEPHYNAGPTQQLPVIKANAPQNLELINWGLIYNWSNNKNISPKLFNLSIDTVLSKRMYQKGLKENRCMIIADGFYLWKQVGKKQNIPYYFYFPDRAPFGIAGLWEDYEDIEGKSAHSFIMLTTNAVTPISAFQDDMPLIIKGNDIHDWLNSEVDTAQLEALPGRIAIENIKSHSVSPLISDLTHNNTHLIKATVPSDQHGNYTLFN